MARNVPQVAQGLPRGSRGRGARFKQPDAARSPHGLLSRRHRPLFVVWPDSMGFNALPKNAFFRSQSVQKSPRFFRRPPHPDDASRRFENPGGITLANILAVHGPQSFLRG